MRRRFIVILDPCGAYFIWDELKLEPVMGRTGGVMAFAGKVEANRTADRLNGNNDNEHRMTAANQTTLAFRSQTRRPDGVTAKKHLQPPTEIYFSLAEPGHRADPIRAVLH